MEININIFVLEDEIERIKWFESTFNDCSMFITCDVDDACLKLKENKYDLIFLDRDLADSTKSGEDVARIMEKDKLNTDACIVVHTVNPVGRINIKKCLDSYHNNVNFIDFTQLKKLKRKDFKLRI